MSRLFFSICRLIIWIFLAAFFADFEISRIHHGIRILMIIMVMVEVGTIIKIIFYSAKLKEKRKTLLISALVIFIFFCLLEITFMFIARTHAVGYTNASRLWSKLYWKPLTEFGHRDKKIEHDQLKPTYFFVGDSFTAGFGIKNIKDRFSDIVSDHLPDVNIYNLGINAIDTRREYLFMQDFIFQSSIVPNKIFLQYYGNDIDDAAFENNINFSGFTPHANMPKFLVKIIRSSYFLDYIYWLFPQGDSGNYWEFLNEAYNSAETLNVHFEDLSKFVEYSSENNIELIVINFPFLQSIEKSNELYVQKINDFFYSKNIKVLDIGNLVKGMSLSQMLVNNNDAHASVRVNRLVADGILELLENNNE